MWADTERDGRPTEYRWHPLLNAEVWLTPTARVPSSKPCQSHPIQENARLGHKMNLARGKVPSGGKSPRKCIYGVPTQETAKDRAKFGWPPVSDVGAVTKPRRETL